MGGPEYSSHILRKKHAHEFQPQAFQESASDVHARTPTLIHESNLAGSTNDTQVIPVPTFRFDPIAPFSPDTGLYRPATPDLYLGEWTPESITSEAPVSSRIDFQPLAPELFFHESFGQNSSDEYYHGGHDEYYADHSSMVDRLMATKFDGMPQSMEMSLFSMDIGGTPVTWSENDNETACSRNSRDSDTSTLVAAQGIPPSRHCSEIIPVTTKHGAPSATKPPSIVANSVLDEVNVILNQHWVPHSSVPATGNGPWLCLESDLPRHASAEILGDTEEVDSLDTSVDPRYPPFLTRTSESEPELKGNSPSSSDSSLTRAGSRSPTDSLMSDRMATDPAWTLDTSNARAILGPDHMFFTVESKIIETLVQSYQDQETPDSGSIEPQKPSSTQAVSEAGNGPRNCQGKRPWQEDESTAHEGEGPATKIRRKQVRPGEARLSCHFQKRDPERYPLCGIRHGGFLTIAHVKQHIRRSHKRNTNYCPRCKDIFDTESQKNAHIVQAFSNPCQERILALPEGIAPEMEEALTRRVEKGSGLHEQWFSIWDMIFPGLPRPSSCTFDLSGETHIQVLGLVSYLESQGPTIVQSILEQNNLAIWSLDLERLGSPPEDVDVFTRGVLSQAFRRIFESWQTQRPESTTTTASSGVERNSSIDSSFGIGYVLPPTPMSPFSNSGRPTDTALSYQLDGRVTEIANTVTIPPIAEVISEHRAVHGGDDPEENGVRTCLTRDVDQSPDTGQTM